MAMAGALPGVESGMSDHDVPIESDGQHGENGHGQQSVAHQREEDAQRLSVHPGAVVEERRCQR